MAPPPARVLCDVGPDHASCGPRAAAAGSQRLTGLLPSAWDFEFAVSAYNGDDDSDVSEWVVPPPPTLGEQSSISIDIELVGNEPAQGVSACLF
ncbi:hypothetical protein B0T26DRAFT_716883 [Lasiosphaeria miniovina]|uniref:Uncharacterized protein n=1 Tax=Lasiosphaeria miniovina TaxID=1954250 RepID=A0AA40ACA8_9PEZI|nr:uncharacterized protein B0T26DRAFT_716883 [Lasiosphaeria miniovina]KAK0713251.1 hypothetical protein B0T26DRAFT_716883 [Lasiosphaeria miniovina]